MINFNKNKTRILLPLFLLCFFFNYSFAQVVYSNKPSSTFSFTLGLTSTGLYRDTISYQQGILFNAGFVYTHTLNQKSNIGVEVLFTGKSIKRSSPIIKYRFGYLDVPVYFQYKLSDNILINAGAQYSKYIASRYYYLDGSRANGVHPEVLKTNMDDDIGLLVGAELGVSKNLFLTARYTYSTKPFFDKSSPYFGVFQFSFRIVFYKDYKQSGKKPATSALF